MTEESFEEDGTELERSLNEASVGGTPAGAFSAGVDGDMARMAAKGEGAL